MKYKYLKLIPILLFCTISHFLAAQEIQQLGQHRVDHHIYSVSKYGHRGRISVKENSTVISRIKNNTKNLTNVEFPSISSKETVTSAFIKVLGRERIRELFPEKYVLVILHYNTDGRTLGVEFILNKETNLTLKEINGLTKFIKKNIIFKIPPDTKLRSKLCTPMMQVIKFKKLLYNEN